MSGAAELLSTIDIETVLSAATERTCYGYCTALASASRDREDERAVALLMLLSDVTAFTLRPDDDPALGHRTAFFDRRVQDVDALDAAELDTLSNIVELLTDAELRSRVADVLFIRRRHNRFVTIAVEAYILVGDRMYSGDGWVEAVDRYVRAFVISCRDRALRDRTTEKVLGIMASRRPDTSYCTALLMEPLLERRLGDASLMAELTRNAAAAADSAGEWERARRYLQLEASWLGVSGDEPGKRRARAEAAERVVLVADEVEKQSAAVAAMHLSSAIHMLRQIPGQQLRVDSLLRKLDEVQRAVVLHFTKFSGEEDITDEVNRVRAQFAGLGKQEVIARLVTMFNVPDSAALQRSVEEWSHRLVSQRLFPLAFVNDRGRVVARRNAIGAGSPEEQEKTLIQAAYESARHQRDFRVATCILPALYQIREEHDFVAADLRWFVESSPFCPSGRAELFARGLVEGFRGEFVIALYMLLPQVEHGIRCMLEDAGAVTWKMDENGIQQDKDLGALLFMREAREMFGPDLLFELRGLLVEKNGTNLRNLAAHGLLDANQSNSRQSVYLWWLTLSLLIKPLLRRRAVEPDDSVNGESGK